VQAVTSAVWPGTGAKNGQLKKSSTKTNISVEAAAAVCHGKD